MLRSESVLALSSAARVVAEEARWSCVPMLFVTRAEKRGKSIACAFEPCVRWARRRRRALHSERTKHRDAITWDDQYS